MKTFLVAVLAGLFAVVAPTAGAASLNVDMDRLVEIEGGIDGHILEQTAQLLALATESRKPVYVSLNSPGGDVLAGMQFVNAVRAVKARGIRVVCFVPNIAMSMAFVILTECSERYAMAYSLLLFHPMSVTLEGSYTAADLATMRDGTLILEAPLLERMINITRIPRAVFLKNYQAQTIWTAEALNGLSPGFTTVVTDFGPATFRVRAQ